MKRPFVDSRASGKRKLNELVHVPPPPRQVTTSSLFAATLSQSSAEDDCGNRHSKRARMVEREEEEMILDPVEQEDGYISPRALSPSPSPEHADELSSPARAPSEGDVLSSPPISRNRRAVSADKARARRVLRPTSPSPDLRPLFIENSGEEDEDDEEAITPDQTQLGVHVRVKVVGMDVELQAKDMDEEEEEEEMMIRERQKQVAMGWRAKYALSVPVPDPRRRADKENSPRLAVSRSSFGSTSVPTPSSTSIKKIPAFAPAPLSTSTKRISTTFADLHVGAVEPQRDIEFEADEAIEDSEVDDFSPPPPPPARSAISLMQRFGRGR